MTEAPSAAIERAILSLCRERGPQKSICPSEAARIVDPRNWRDQMDAVRAAAAHLARQGRIEATQAGRVVELEAARGPVRLRITSHGSEGNSANKGDS